MKTLEKVLAVALFIVGGLGLITSFGVAGIDNFQALILVLSITFVLLGVLSLFYGYVRRTNLRQGVANSKDRTSPPGQFLALGWSMLAISVILVGMRIFWFH